MIIDGPWRFRLRRQRDASGVSGTGHIADGVQFQDGTCVLRWRTSTSSTAVYASHEQLMRIHGHEGQTVTEWIDEPPSAAFKRGWYDCVQDSDENNPFSSVGGLDARASGMAAPAYITREDAAEFLRGYEAAAEVMHGANWRTVAFGWTPALVIGAE